MVSIKKYFWLCSILSLNVIVPSCRAFQIKEFLLNDLAIHTLGRTAFDVKNGLVLVSSASGVAFDFKGDSCIIWCRNLTTQGNHGYVSIELDGIYNGRIKITDTLSQRITILPTHRNEVHEVKIIKSTEAATGAISIVRMAAREILPPKTLSNGNIEFIGNSITCGMGNDTLDIPCGVGQWYDQHNAYFSYASIAARALDLEPMLSSVSGIGIYRCWDVDCPAMPEVYENLQLSSDSSQRWDFTAYTPDLLAICLGTNDFSDGDGVHARKPFDSTVFVQRYVDFIHTLYSHYPSTQIVLLTSPMVGGDKNVAFYRHLHTIADRINRLRINRPQIKVFQFSSMTPGGCSYHPSKEDHQVMADQLIPFLKTFFK